MTNAYQPQGTATAARDVREGDALDLYGDRYADPDRDPGLGLEFELAQVVEPNGCEGPACVVIYTDSGTFACPPDHVLYVKREG